MAASQVVLYFDKQEDALLFTLAASSMISEDGAARADEALVKVAAEIRALGRKALVLGSGTSAVAGSKPANARR